MFKFLLLTALLLTGLNANTYVVVDIAQGISKKEFNELGKILYPDTKASKNIYTHKEDVFLYSFNATNSISNEFTYYHRDKDEEQYKDGKKAFNSFFAKVKKYGVKKRKKISSNIIFLVDTSGSMKKNGVMQDVKNTIEYLINEKSKNSKIAIVTFDGKSYMKESKRSKVLSGFEKSKSKLLKTLSSIKPSPYDTYLGSGLSKTQKLLSQVDGKKSMVLLFTDGKAVDDHDKALSIVKNFKQNGVKLKVVAVGGADVDMLKNFSTTGYVFNATSNDLKDMAYGMSVGGDAIFLRLNNFIENSPQLSKDDRLIIYSSMMNVDAQSDFYIVPNIASSDFYKEIQQINTKRDANFKLNGAKVYVRLLGKMSATEVNKLKIFYKHYFKDTGADLKFFANTSLSKKKLH